MFHCSALINKFQYDEGIHEFFQLPQEIKDCVFYNFEEKTYYKDLDNMDYVGIACSCLKNASEKFSSPYCN